MATAEKTPPRESGKYEHVDYHVQRQEYHALAFGFAVNTIRYMGKPLLLDEPGKKVRRLRTTNWVRHQPVDTSEINTNIRIQYVEIGDNEDNLPVKRFEIYSKRELVQDKPDFEPPVLVATLEDPSIGASAIRYDGAYIPESHRLQLDALFVQMTHDIREAVQAESVRR